MPRFRSTSAAVLALVTALVTTACTGSSPTASRLASSTSSSPSLIGPTATTTRPPPTTGPPPATSAPPRTAPPATGLPPATAAPPSGERARVISRGDPNRPMVALTFDAGSDTGFASDILDTLSSARVTASFGITGRWAEANPALVTRMAREGHQIVNHTWDHSSFTGVSARPAVLGRAARIDQLERTDALIASLTGSPTKPWFRAPYGDYDATVNADVAAAGYRYNVLWTVDSLGWQGLSAADITSRCVSRTVAGAILLLHVGSQSQDAAALPSIISALRVDGYTFGTVSQVVGT